MARAVALQPPLIVLLKRSLERVERAGCLQKMLRVAVWLPPLAVLLRPPLLRPPPVKRGVLGTDEATPMTMLAETPWPLVQLVAVVTLSPLRLAIPVARRCFKPLHSAALPPRVTKAVIGARSERSQRRHADPRSGRPNGSWDSKLGTRSSQAQSRQGRKEPPVRQELLPGIAQGIFMPTLLPLSSRMR